MTDVKSAVYIGSLWLQPRLNIILNSVARSGSTDGKLTQGLSARGRCEATSSGRDTDWFLNNVAVGLILPSTDAVKFGMLRVGTGRCARLLTATGRIALQDCLQSLYVRPPKEMTFELLHEGQLKVLGKSVSITVITFLFWCLFIRRVIVFIPVLVHERSNKLVSLYFTLCQSCPRKSLSILEDQLKVLLLVLVIGPHVLVLVVVSQKLVVDTDISFSEL